MSCRRSSSGVEGAHIAAETPDCAHVRRQGDLLHAAGRRRAGGRPPSSAASPAAICGRAASRTARPAALQVLRHRLRRHRRPRRRQVRRPPATSPRPAAPHGGRCRHAVFVVLTGGEPMLQVDERVDRGTARARLHHRHRDQRHAPRAARHRLDLRQPQGRHRPQQRSGDELKLVYPQADARPDAMEDLDFTHPTCSRWTVARSPANHRAAHRLLQGPPEMAPDPTDPQAARAALSPAQPGIARNPLNDRHAHLQRVPLRGRPLSAERRTGPPNARVHGHSFRARVTIDGAPDPETGYIVHFDELGPALAEAHDALDHRLLNEVDGL